MTLSQASASSNWSGLITNENITIMKRNNMHVLYYMSDSNNINKMCPLVLHYMCQETPRLQLWKGEKKMYSGSATWSTSEQRFICFKPLYKQWLKGEQKVILLNHWINRKLDQLRRQHNLHGESGQYQVVCPFSLHLILSLSPSPPPCSALPRQLGGFGCQGFLSLGRNISAASSQSAVPN